MGIVTKGQILVYPDIRQEVESGLYQVDFSPIPDAVKRFSSPTSVSGGVLGFRQPLFIDNNEGAINEFWYFFKKVQFVKTGPVTASAKYVDIIGFKTSIVLTDKINGVYAIDYGQAKSYRVTYNGKSIYYLLAHIDMSTFPTEESDFVVFATNTQFTTQVEGIIDGYFNGILIKKLVEIDGGEYKTGINSEIDARYTEAFYYKNNSYEGLNIGRSILTQQTLTQESDLKDSPFQTSESSVGTSDIFIDMYDLSMENFSVPGDGNNTYPQSRTCYVCALAKSENHIYITYTHGYIPGAAQIQQARARIDYYNSDTGTSLNLIDDISLLGGDLNDPTSYGYFEINQEYVYVLLDNKINIYTHTLVEAGNPAPSSVISCDFTESSISFFPGLARIFKLNDFSGFVCTSYTGKSNIVYIGINSGTVKDLVDVSDIDSFGGITPETTLKVPVISRGDMFLAYQGHRKVFTGDADNDTCYLYAFTLLSSLSWKALKQASIEDNTVKLSIIIKDLLSRVGICSTIVDTSDIEDIQLKGYSVKGAYTAIESISQLQQVFNLDIIEEEGIIKFKKRSSKTSVLSLTDDDINCYVGERTHTSLQIENVDEKPKAINVAFIDVNDDFNVNNASLYHQLVQDPHFANIKYNNSQNFEFPYVTTLEDAQNIANRLLQESWVFKKRYSFTLPVNYLKLSPGDVITFNGLLVEIVRIDFSYPSFITVEAVTFDSDAYTSNIVGDSTVVNDTSIYLLGSVKGYILHLPVWHNIPDYWVDSRKIYYGAHSNGGTWTVGLLRHQLKHKEEYPTHSWSSQSRKYIGRGQLWIETETIVGNVIEILNNFETPAYVDTVNVIKYQPVHGTFPSFTDKEFLDDEGLIAIGNKHRWEIISYRDVTDNGDGTYSLGYLLRGLRGTVNNIDSHIGEEIVIFLDPYSDTTIYSEFEDRFARIDHENNNRFLSFGYRYVPADAGDIHVLPPESQAINIFHGPVSHIKGLLEIDGTLHLTWTPSTRVYFQIEDGSEGFEKESVGAVIAVANPVTEKVEIIYYTNESGTYTQGVNPEFSTVLNDINGATEVYVSIVQLNGTGGGTADNLTSVKITNIDSRRVI